MKNSSKIFKKHNHSNCSKQALKAFEKHCFEKNLQVTPLRRKILEYLLKDHRPLGAYEILDLLRGRAAHLPRGRDTSHRHQRVGRPGAQERRNARQGAPSGGRKDEAPRALAERSLAATDGIIIFRLGRLIGAVPLC